MWNKEIWLKLHFKTIQWKLQNKSLISKQKKKKKEESINPKYAEISKPILGNTGCQVSMPGI